MMKIVGFGLLGLFALMILPSGVTDQVNPMFYGTADMVLADSEGNVLLTQTVHNRITDEGENFIIDQVFDTGDAALTDFNRAGMVCVIEQSDSAFAETTLSTLTNNLANGGAGNRCHQVTDVNDVTPSQAILAPAAFTAATDFDAGQTISGILICLKNGDDNDIDACDAGTNDVALAALDLANVTVSGTDTITITYTFDITTAGS